MPPKRIFWRAVAGLAAAASGCVAAHAGSLTVFPVRVQLSPEEPVQTMTIQNGGGEPARVQLRVYSWRQANGEDVLEETRDVLANPGLFEIAPSGEQIARFGLRADARAEEASYRVVLDEIPVDQALRPGEVRTLLRISIPIFVPAAAPVRDIAWRAWPVDGGRVTLAIHNRGNTHVQLSGLTLARAGGEVVAEQDMSVYVLPGALREVTIDAARPVNPGETLVLAARTDQGDLAADIVSEALRHEAARP